MRAATESILNIYRHRNHKHRYKLVTVLDDPERQGQKLYMFHCQEPFCPEDVVRTIRKRWFWTTHKKNHPCGENNTCHIECEGWCK